MIDGTSYPTFFEFDLGNVIKFQDDGFQIVERKPKISIFKIGKLSAVDFWKNCFERSDEFDKSEVEFKNPISNQVAKTIFPLLDLRMENDTLVFNIALNDVELVFPI